MVFVCSNCNSSLRKAQVKFHACNAKFSCLTCNLEFDKITSQNHLICISEAQKYQGSDFKANKNENKGLNRQNNWNLIVIDSLENFKTEDFNLNEGVKVLKRYQNIPQKENKFMNFMKSITFFKKNPSYVKTIWDIIISHKLSLNQCVNDENQSEETGSKKRKIEDLTSQDEPNSKVSKIDTTNSDKVTNKMNKKTATDKIESVELCESLENGVKVTKKKKSKKLKMNAEKEIQNENMINKQNDEINVSKQEVEQVKTGKCEKINEPKEKSKKKNKSKIESMGDCSISTDIDVKPITSQSEITMKNIEVTPSKKGKKSKKQENQPTQYTNQSEIAMENTSEGVSSKKEKKLKKQENQSTSSLNQTEITVKNCEEVTFSKKEKKLKKQENLLTHSTEVLEFITNDIENKTKIKNKKPKKRTAVEIIEGDAILEDKTENIKEQISSFIDEIRQSGSDKSELTETLVLVNGDQPKKKKRKSDKK